MNRATRVAASALGAYAGLLGIEHGVFEILRGTGAPDAVLISAIGPPCQADAVWHACLPAMTVVPSFLATGILAVVLGLVVIVWAAAFVRRRGGGLVLMGLSVALLLVGGGFVPPFVGLVAGAAGTQIDAALSRWRQRQGSAVHFLATLWPWPLIVLLVWFPGAWLMGALFEDAMLALGSVLFFLFDLGLPLLTVLTGVAHDVRQP
jgi:hypothetical protein